MKLVTFYGIQTSRWVLDSSECYGNHLLFEFRRPLAHIIDKVNTEKTGSKLRAVTQQIISFKSSIKPVYL